jgi:elongation factor P
MIDTSDFRRGLKILFEGAPWEVIEYQHVKMQMRKAHMKTRMRNLLTGAVLEKNFQSTEKFPVPDLQYRKMQYLYNDGGYVFMDHQSYDQVTFNDDQVADARLYLKENLDCDVVFFEGNPISISLPNHMVLKITRTDPGLKGDTVSNVTKPATLETGAVVQVPLFVNEGEHIRVDTRTGEYIERVSV